MQENDYGSLIERWKVDLIRAKARRFGFRRDELPDIEQMLVLELLSVTYAPAQPDGASERTFITTIIDRRLTNIRRDRRRHCRRTSYEARSLDSDTVVAEEAGLQVHHAPDPGLCLDLEQAVMGLTLPERAICQALSEGRSQTDIARGLGCNRSTICRRVASIADKLRRWGLDAYFPNAAATDPPKR